MPKCKDLSKHKRVRKLLLIGAHKMNGTCSWKRMAILKAQKNIGKWLLLLMEGLDIGMMPVGIVYSSIFGKLKTQRLRL